MIRESRNMMVNLSVCSNRYYTLLFLVCFYSVNEFYKVGLVLIAFFSL